VFVGNKVNDEDSDVLDVVRFLAGFLNNDSRAKEWIKDLIDNRARLLDSKQRDIFKDRFLPLLGQSPDAVYADILKKLFNSDSRQRLKLVNMKGCSGELALRVGDEPFGLINIGDDAAFYKLCEDQTDFDTEADEFAASLFGSINRKDSRLHILIGSRKFTEGWSSWRVSTMGLLNMGQGEGVSDHPALWPGSTAERAKLLIEAKHTGATAQGAAPGTAGDPQHLRCPGRVYGQIQGISAGRGHYPQR